jgi:hypothetical protein
MRKAAWSLEYGRSASIAIWTMAMTAPASAPTIVNPRMRLSLALTKAFMFLFARFEVMQRSYRPDRCSVTVWQLAKPGEFLDLRFGYRRP